MEVAAPIGDLAMQLGELLLGTAAVARPGPAAGDYPLRRGQLTGRNSKNRGLPRT
jgi:hypothetical protein